MEGGRRLTLLDTKFHGHNKNLISLLISFIIFFFWVRSAHVRGIKKPLS